MLNFLFTILFITATSIYVISGEAGCIKTSYYWSSPDKCPSHMVKVSREHSFWVFWKYDLCCPRTTQHIDPETTTWSRFGPSSTFQQQYQPEGPIMTRPPYNRPNLLSPRVASISWGHVHVEGMNEHFKDIKLFPGGAKSWDWKETNTRHQPGIQPADLRELFEKDCEIIILSRGIQNMLYTKDETRDELERRGMREDRDYFILQSEEAVQRYNHYVDQRKRVCAVIHSTC